MLSGGSRSEPESKHSDQSEVSGDPSRRFASRTFLGMTGMGMSPILAICVKAKRRFAQRTAGETSRPA
jgi:hypothetical protein